MSEGIPIARRRSATTMSWAAHLCASAVSKWKVLVLVCARIATTQTGTRSDFNSTALLLFAAESFQIFSALGRVSEHGQSLLELASADPSLLKRLASSRGGGPLSQQERASGKLSLALLEAGYATGAHQQPVGSLAP